MKRAPRAEGLPPAFLPGTPKKMPTRANHQGGPVLVSRAAWLRKAFLSRTAIRPPAPLHAEPGAATREWAGGCSTCRKAHAGGQGESGRLGVPYQGEPQQQGEPAATPWHKQQATPNPTRAFRHRHQPCRWGPARAAVGQHTAEAGEAPRTHGDRPCPCPHPPDADQEGGRVGGTRRRLE